MLDALYVGATGMQAQQLHVDTIANNLVNVQTPGFKKGRISFTDLVVQGASRVPTGVAVEEVAIWAERPRVGAGVGIGAITKMFDLGDLRKTDSAWDIAIQGDGFIEVSMPDGSTTYTRGGTLKVNQDGVLSTASGVPLRAAIAIPENSQSLTIARDGKVWVQVPDQSAPTEIGQLDLVRFMSPSGLSSIGDGSYRSTQASGEAMPARPGEDGAGTFSQGFVEGSNVRMVDEMVNLMLAQRAYEASAKVVQASDEMLGMINGLRK